MIVLGLDLGSRCGWAVLRDGERVASGVWDLRPQRHEGNGMRFLRFRKYLREALSATEADVVAYEEVRRHMGTHAAHVYGALWGALVAELDQEGKPYRGIPVATVKRCATGKGNANKQAMVAAFERRVGELPEDDNEADALFIALALHNEIGADDS